MRKLVCIIGMTGSGKSIISNYFVTKGYQFLRFGQITLDIIKERGLEPTEANERKIREDLRHQYGMAAFASLNITKISELLKKGNVVGDGLYSWSEYKLLKELYGKGLIVIAVFSPPELRYSRLEKRTIPRTDIDLRMRKLSKEDAKSRDYREIEYIEKAGPIAMADYTILSLGSQKELLEQVEKVYKEISSLK